MDKDKVPPIIGAVLLVAGIVVMFFVFYQAMMMVSGVGDYFREQFPEEEGDEEGPQAAFSWSTNDLEVNFRDESEQGDAEIRHWDWDFGDGDSSNQREPTHTYTSEGDWRVRLEVEDQNGKTSSTDADVNVEWGRNDGGETERRDFGGIEIGFGNFLSPLAAALLVGMLFMIMFLVGAAMVKAGWNLVKPGPSTLKLKIKPKKLEVEQAHPDPAYSTQQAPSRNPVSAQPQPVYQPQPSPDAVIASMRALPANQPQPATQASYPQQSYDNYPQQSVGSYKAASQPVAASPPPLSPPAPPLPQPGFSGQTSPPSSDTEKSIDPSQTSLGAYPTNPVDTPEDGSEPTAEQAPPPPPENTSDEEAVTREVLQEKPSQAQAGVQQTPPKQARNPPQSNQSRGRNQQNTQKRQKTQRPQTRRTQSTRKKPKKGKRKGKGKSRKK
jgi:PKD repeat protein